MALLVEEENYVKKLYIDKTKSEQIKILEDKMWKDVENLKKSQSENKWEKIVERKHEFYIERDNILNE